MIPTWRPELEAANEQTREVVQDAVREAYALATGKRKRRRLRLRYWFALSYGGAEFRVITEFGESCTLTHEMLATLTAESTYVYASLLARVESPDQATDPSSSVAQLRLLLMPGVDTVARGGNYAVLPTRLTPASVALRPLVLATSRRPQGWPL